jgi:hypothetical protein
MIVSINVSTIDYPYESLHPIHLHVALSLNLLESYAKVVNLSDLSVRL